MNDFIIETRNLSYHFGKEQVLNDISLQVPKSSIYGFLGPNGAGKTTTIRLLLGLLHQPEDQIFLFGTSFKKERITILNRVGALVEEPSFYGHLSAKENLKVIALLRKAPLNRIDEVLRIVQLQKDGTRKVKNFSLGMKQRLALAMALLSEPSLLVLDEPTNGLDPQGIVDIREFLLTINKETGVSIFLSTHLLSEAEKLATVIGILFQGRLLFQGAVDELKQIKSNSTTLQIETNDLNKTAQVLASAYKVVKKDLTSLHIEYKSQSQIPEIARLLVQHDLDIYRIAPSDYSLENFFLSLTTS